MGMSLGVPGRIFALLSLGKSVPENWLLSELFFNMMTALTVREIGEFEEGGEGKGYVSILFCPKQRCCTYQFSESCILQLC